MNGENGTPTTSHKKHSLAEYLYQKQIRNTQKLLDDKISTQTAPYTDERRKLVNLSVFSNYFFLLKAIQSVIIIKNGNQLAPVLL